MRVCVFGSSSSKTSKAFTDAAYDLGLELAKRGCVCVNGGGATGVMGALNSGCSDGKGEIIGVIHEMFVVDGQEDSRIKKMVVCKGDDLKERKQMLLDNADCIVVMPGGVGTLDELWDAVCTKSLGLGGLNNKPIALVNVDGYFDGSLAQLQAADRAGLLHSAISTYFEVHSTGAEAVDWCAKQLHDIQAGTFLSGNRYLARKRESEKSSSGPTVPALKTPNTEEVEEALLVDASTEPKSPMRMNQEKHAASVLAEMNTKSNADKPCSPREGSRPSCGHCDSAMHLIAGIAIGVVTTLALSHFRHK